MIVIDRILVASIYKPIKSLSILLQILMYQMEENVSCR
jgi:hypothetical protein